MKKIDRYIRHRILEEECEVPVSVQVKINQTLENLPKEGSSCTRKTKSCKNHKITFAVACFVFMFLFFLPNISPMYAQALEKIPVIGEIVKVITIRNYFYSDDTHVLDVRVPRIEQADNKALDTVNTGVEELADALVEKFYQELEEFGGDSHSAVFVDYEVITDTPDWFTLKLNVDEIAGSSNTYYKYYNLDKQTGKIMLLSDFAENMDFYSAVEQEIKSQMLQQMEEDNESVYYIEKDSFGKEFADITPDHNYFWNAGGDLVIPFDKYEVAPGFMGAPEFTIDFTLLKDYINHSIYETVTG